MIFLEQTEVFFREKKRKVEWLCTFLAEIFADEADFCLTVAAKSLETV